MKPVEQLGLLKMDFLGLRNLDVIEDALDIVERSTGERPDMGTLPLDHEPTYEMLAQGDSIGVFQFESEGMREALKKVRPTEFDDLVALVALYRPGAMDQIPTYARGKRDPETISYADDRLRPILESTKGVILYQEQAMQIAKELAGFSGAKADDLRKAIGKKNREAMAKLKPEFVEGCRRSGTSESVIEMLWTTNERSADYSFKQVRIWTDARDPARWAEAPSLRGLSQAARGDHVDVGGWHGAPPQGAAHRPHGPQAGLPRPLRQRSADTGDGRASAAQHRWIHAG